MQVRLRSEVPIDLKVKQGAEEVRLPVFEKRSQVTFQMVLVISHAFSHFFSVASVHASPSFVLARRTGSVGSLAKNFFRLS